MRQRSWCDTFVEELRSQLVRLFRFCLLFRTLFHSTRFPRLLPFVVFVATLIRVITYRRAIFFGHLRCRCCALHSLRLGTYMLPHSFLPSKGCDYIPAIHRYSDRITAHFATPVDVDVTFDCVPFVPYLVIFIFYSVTTLF